MSLFVTPRIVIPDDELEEKFIRSSGPGGQNVNKVASAVQLRFDARNSPSLTELARTALLFGGLLTRDGMLVITEGLKAGEKVVVQGQQRIRDGMTVAPSDAPARPKQ